MSTIPDISQINFEVHNREVAAYNLPRDPLVGYLEDLLTFSLRLNDLKSCRLQFSDEQFLDSVTKICEYAKKLLKEYFTDFEKLRDRKLIEQLLENTSHLKANPLIKEDQKEILGNMEKSLEENKKNIVKKPHNYLPPNYNRVQSSVPASANNDKVLISSIPLSYHKARSDGSSLHRSARKVSSNSRGNHQKAASQKSTLQAYNHRNEYV